jgi:hypothetical protein
LRAGDTATIGPLVRAIGGALTGLGSEVELSAGSSLALKLNAVRNEVRALLAAEIDRVPASVRRLLVFPTSDESGVGVAVAAVAAAERDVDMVQSVRPFAGALALGTDVSSALTQIRIWIEGAIAALLAGLRGALGAARGLFLLQISHAVRICAKLFGKQYASGIVAATERALRDERRAA